jgi:hypothetical protein
MSIFSSIASAEHTFVNWFEKEITAVEKAAPTIERDAEAAFTYSTTGLTIIAQEVEPGSAAAGIISKAISDLKVASATVYDFGANPTVGGFIQTVVKDLGALEGAAGIKNAGTVATVAKVISTLAALAEAFLAVAPAA